MKKQSGFTLIEFTVAMAVTLVALAATMLAFKDATNANQNVTFRQDMSDNIRAGMNLIEQDLIETGTGIPTGGISIPSFSGGGCTGGYYSNINRPLPSGSGIFPTCNTALPSIEPGADLGPLITSPDATSSVNTDVITMLYADNTLGLDVQPIVGGACGGSIGKQGEYATFDTSNGCVQIGASGVQVEAGDLIMFSNSLGNAIEQVTSVSWPTIYFAKGDAFNLNQTGAPQGTIIQLQNTTNGVANGTYPTTTATRVWMVTYYLDNVTDPTHVRLIRRVNFNPGQPVGETLENLQFSYNFNDGKMANQPSVPTGYSESQIRSVNLYVGTRSVNRSEQTHQYMRENFQTMVSLRSMAYVNRYK